MAGADRRSVGGALRLAYLGPPGTFTEEAAHLYAPDAELLPFSTVGEAAAAVRRGQAGEAMAPIENSLQGPVTETLDLLIHEEGLHICYELAMSIVHNLVARPGTAMDKISRVYSHPQALGQCQGYLERTLPGVELAASLSTAAAVEQALREGSPSAAIAPRRAAELYGGEILASGIQDDSSNVTRFLALGHQDHAPTGDDKTSVCFSFDEDRSGQLYRVMGEFAQRNINLTKVESRPSKQALGDYIFLIDLEGHREDPMVQAAIDTVRIHTSMLKIFGSYPRWNG